MPALDERRYQVFVSSTFNDLVEERQQVLQAVLEMKAFPSGMELFPSADDEQWAFIEREIESSDYYVVIVAGKYGSVAEDGRSFTEKEYDYAVNLNKYVISFICRDLQELEGRRLEQDPAIREKLEAFHQKVKRSKLVKSYASPEELKALTMQALVHAFQFQPQEGWVRAKNARRIEDLEDVTRLQRSVMELQEELAALRSDPTSPYAQADDPAEWTLHLKALPMPRSSPSSPAPPPKEPPASLFAFRTTWNRLLAAIFTAADPGVRERDVQIYILGLIASQLAELHPDSEQWLELWNTAGVGIEDEDATKLMTSIKLQFLGLGLIDVEHVQASRYSWSEWRLTQRGRLQLLAINGLRRAAAGEEASA